MAYQFKVQTSNRRLHNLKFLLFPFSFSNPSSNLTTAFELVCDRLQHRIVSFINFPPVQSLFNIQLVIKMSVTTQFTPLFQAVEQHGYSTLTSSLVTLLLPMKERASILETIKSKDFHKNHARRLFGAILPTLQHTIEKEEFIPVSAFEEDEKRDRSEKIFTNDTIASSSISQRKTSNTSHALLFIKYTALMINAYLVNLSSKRENIQRHRSYDVMEEVKELMESLHNLLFDLNSCGVEGLSVQKSIVALCESYWNGNFINRNDYVASVIPLLMVRTLDETATKADIKRLWNMREAMKILSFQEECSAYLRSLIVRTVGSGFFLKNVEGRKLICYFFQLDCGLVKNVHEAIKAQIPLAKKPELLYYGEIYSRAWKEALALEKEEEDGCHDRENGGDEDDSCDRSRIQAAIEDALQELMNASVHVVSPHMATSLRTVLEPLLSQKKNPEVEMLLYKIYTPFLWRSLSAANPRVRVNASSALFKTFPLRDPNSGKLHLKEVYAKTVESLLNLLHDEDHKVRVAGCDATIQILGFYWDSLSSTDIRSLMNEIVMKHGNDATSSAVRAQAVNGINQLLDAKASHGVLRPLLPYLGDLIHDKVEKVRLATVKLLLKLKKIKGFKFFHTVPKEHLLARLAAEGKGVKTPTGPLASALSDLLLNSYYPKKVEVSESIRRTVGFLEENPMAARVFYSNVAFHLEIKSVCKLIKLLLKCIKIGVAREREGAGCDEGEVLDYGDLVSTITASNIGLMAEIGATILTLLNSVSPLSLSNQLIILSCKLSLTIY
jgi:condensin-2 complex subunit G2